MIPPWFPRIALVSAVCVSLGAMPGIGVPPEDIGLPLTRTYALEDIGDTSRAVHLGFDSAGRLAVISGDGFFVLNDATWLDLAGENDRNAQLSRLETDAEGRAYFGALANWGMVDFGSDGKLRLRSLRPEEAPEWVDSVTFTRIIPHARGVLFAGFNGLVNWDRATGTNTYYDTHGVTAAFTLNSRILISSFSGGTQVLDLEKQRFEPAPGHLGRVVADCAVTLDDGRALVSSLGRRLLVCDDTGVHDWSAPLLGLLNTRVSTMKRLPEGGVAVAINGRGLFLLSADGTPHIALTSSDYHRIQDLAVREPGVLWVATENAVQKVLYGNSVKIVDQRLGVPLSWPHVVSWQDRTLVASGGQLYQTVQGSDGVSSHFEPVPGLPEHGAWSVAVAGPHLLISNKSGVFVRNGQRFEPVISGMDVTQLVMIGNDLCYVIGNPEIAAIRLVEGRWVETAPRIPSVGFPYIVHPAGRSAWIELGAGRVARITCEDTTLRARVFQDLPWKNRPWVTVGSMRDIVVINGGPAGTMFFNESTGELCDAPEVRRLIEHAPFPVMRLTEDARGWIWVTHDKGVYVAHRDASQASGFRFDTTIARDLRDYQPRVEFLDAERVAISTDRTVYIVTRDAAPPAPPQGAPLLTAIVDRRTGDVLYSANHDAAAVSRFAYGQNSLLFRFFSGSYRLLRPVEYEFTLVGGSRPWSVRETTSHLDLHDLNEGNYRLTAQVLDGSAPRRPPLVLTFQIAAPWYRSRGAYVVYAASSALAVWGLLYWALGRARRHNASLEKLVRERTEELRSTMSQLNEETRATAIYAERTRLAGEIHDSVQQGLSGMLLQVGVTLKLPDLTPEMRSKLETVKNMISFTRHEVQQSVWNLESPLLESTALPDALAKLASLIGSGAPRIKVETRGCPASLPPAMKHNLLRIAQEGITNAVRHANAQTISVILAASDDQLTLEIRDDGVGFSPENMLAMNTANFGLRGMRARAAKIGAEFTIASAPSSGTTVQVRLALKAPTSLPAHASPA